MDFPWCPKPKPTFQFYDMWMRGPSFLPLIASIKSQLTHTDPITKMKGFLKNGRSTLQKPNKNKYADLRTPLCKARADLKDEWISYGDDYTRYFFAKIKHRKIATYILSIQDDKGQTRQGFLEVKEVMHNYYKNLLGKQHSVRQPIDPKVIAIGNTLTVEQQLKLCASFIDQEIKSVKFSIPNTKSPGPDGFSSGFFKATWHLTGELVRGVIHQFFQIGLIPGFLGETKLVLILKSLTPHRPRSLDQYLVVMLFTNV
ncbi:hypothetical protein Cgig2_021594 [Carnegiea gigantea]|uniref:Reverse transcriptase n=1 Tax=Carnegiea gigantea TaxID=171969 RepID=A0A9Q1GJ45_9CARY|nr:hypothetical protein Cgig2_021594 [Carnegiea gigantea]